jgi:hypothetical protein
MKMNEQSLWNNSAIEETIKRTDPEKYYKYQKMAQSLFEKSNIDDPHIINIEAATQIRLMLRDGLHPSLLDENEKELYISTFGQESFDEFGQTTILSTPPSTPTENLVSQKVAHSMAKKRPRSYNNRKAAKRVAFFEQPLLELQEPLVQQGLQEPQV